MATNLQLPGAYWPVFEHFCKEREKLAFGGFVYTATFAKN